MNRAAMQWINFSLPMGKVAVATALAAAALALGLLPQSARAQLVVDYTFNANTNVPDNGQVADVQTLGGLASFSNVTVSLNLTNASGNTMWLGDLYSTLTFGTASEAERVAVLLNRPGRDNTIIAGSSLGSLNVTLDDTAATNIWGTTSTTGTYQSDGRLGVNPAGPRVAFSSGDRNATLSALNGAALASNKFTLLMADYSLTNQAKLTSWGMSLTGTAAASGTMAATNGTMAISDGAGTTNTLGASVTTTQNGSGGTLVVNLAGTTTFAGGMTGSGALNKQGVGTLIISSAGSYTGATTVSGGTLNAGAAGALGSTSGITVNSSGTLAISGSGTLNRINNSAGITLAGGTILRSGSGTVSEGSGATTVGNVVTSGTNTTGLGALTLTASSTLNFGTGGLGTLVFADFIPNSNVLSILNWTSSANFALGNSGVDGTDDRLIFATDQSGNLANFNFGGGLTAMEIALGGGYFEIVAVPEPGTWVAGGLALAALIYMQRRRFTRIISVIHTTSSPTDEPAVVGPPQEDPRSKKFPSFLKTPSAYPKNIRAIRVIRG